MAPSELGVAQAAAAIRAGDLTAQALAEALLARCAAAASLNAFISLEPDRVRAAALRADQQRARGDRLGPLHGVPLVLKDNIDTADFPTTAGTPALAANRPKRNAPIVQRLLDAGATVLGKANLQELAWGPTNNNAAFGPARNPYDLTRIPGGSSGGTGAAVAARLAPAGLGTDTGGSIRVPASLSGVVSLRPTTLRWPQAGIVPISHTRDTAGPMARCVADCALIDGIVTGGRTEVAAARLDGLRIGVPRGHFWEDLDDEVGRVLEPVLAQLRDAGVVLVEGDVADVAPSIAQRALPIALYEFVTDLNDYLTEHDTGLDFARVVAQAKTDDVGAAAGVHRHAGNLAAAVAVGNAVARHCQPDAAVWRCAGQQDVMAIVFGRLCNGQRWRQAVTNWQHQTRGLRRGGGGGSGQTLHQ